jgi:hypothetical protein
MGTRDYIEGLGRTSLGMQAVGDCISCGENLLSFLASGLYEQGIAVWLETLSFEEYIT